MLSLPNNLQKHLKCEWEKLLKRKRKRKHMENENWEVEKQKWRRNNHSIIHFELHTLVMQIHTIHSIHCLICSNSHSHQNHHPLSLLHSSLYGSLKWMSSHTQSHSKRMSVVAHIQHNYSHFNTHNPFPLHHWIIWWEQTKSHVEFVLKLHIIQTPLHHYDDIRMFFVGNEWW